MKPTSLSETLAVASAMESVTAGEVEVSSSGLVSKPMALFIWALYYAIPGTNIVIRRFVMIVIIDI